ncbi:MAG: NAD(P)/FAD-dependent oxidoreductase [Kordiimonadaceae bacterium]|jgi:sulfide:quinone oxidoreductase|nr:NAD(P)/FAD-dependent oxidoreductase [Kordiimonadaceae bacterium]MBT6030984.1 NAD(P)/FAD-dependent oxidoreductase [Kordiimonadaceae bacterium]MBT6329994.1 NAD(P)/FAD-dependent oxidoreductase [Kordiimonadaceae bacterium]MBT7581644.1 NAD(P)/FAD-dependent oxidoreductase [Kordiimonadaceae bacterium]
MNDQANSYDIVIVGGGSAGIATAASLLIRRHWLNIAIVEPKEDHYYQPGWTMVGGGIFVSAETIRSEESVIPDGVTWLKDEVTTFDPDNNSVNLKSGGSARYKSLVVAPGLKLNLTAVDGLAETMGKNGVTSNYILDSAPYTWELVQKFHGGKAIFTQPPLPFKCAGAPQKAMYLSCSEWESKGILDDCDVEFCSAGPSLFGVADYIPPLMEYVERYNANLSFSHNLVAVDGERKVATFAVTDADGNKSRVEKEFDMLHVCPPQCALDFVANSPLAADNGFLAVDINTLQSTKYPNVFGAGDTIATLNAKTAAAARKQAVVVAENLLAEVDGNELMSLYEGYGSCPLTVTKGKIILAEFGYGGKIMSTFPSWMNNTFKATRRAWVLKADILPWVYWNYMLKGKEYFAGSTKKKEEH